MLGTNSEQTFKIITYTLYLPQHEHKFYNIYTSEENL